MRRTGIRERFLDSLARRLERWADSLRGEAGESNPTAEMSGESKAFAAPVEARQVGGPPAHWLAQARALEGGPPDHWLEQVQRHAPGLLEEENAEAVVGDADTLEVDQPQAALPAKRPDPRPPAADHRVLEPTDGVQSTQLRRKAPAEQIETDSRNTEYSVRKGTPVHTSPAAPPALAGARRPQRRSAISHISQTEQPAHMPGSKDAPVSFPRVAPARLQQGEPTRGGEYRVSSTKYRVENKRRVAPAALPERTQATESYGPQDMVRSEPQMYQEQRNRSQLMSEMLSTQYAGLSNHAVTQYPHTVIDTISQDASDSYWPELPDRAPRLDHDFENALRAREHIRRLEEEQRER